MCMTCASQASPLLSTLPYGITAAAAVALGRYRRSRAASGDPETDGAQAEEQP